MNSADTEFGPNRTVKLNTRPLVFLGFGAVAHCLLPLLEQHFSLDLRRVTILEPRDQGSALASWERKGARRFADRLTPENYRQVLEARVSPGAVLIDLSVCVDTYALVEWCRSRGVLYLNASVELWSSDLRLDALPPPERTLYPRHLRLLPWRRQGSGPTAVLDHGANPGLVSHFVKAALVDLAQALNHPGVDERGFGVLAQDLGVKVIHIAEKDSQRSALAREPGEFVNTWSVDGFVEEALAPAEMGWGTHESELPRRAYQHAKGPGHQICLAQPGWKTKVRTWVPSGPTVGMVIRHGEAFTISEHLSVHDPRDGRVVYRPTVHFAYRPAEAARLSLEDLEESGWTMPGRQRILGEEITSGTDELGVLLMGHALRSWWYGSELSIEESRTLVPGQNATTVQVAAGLAGALGWLVQHPDAGVVVPDDLPWQEVLAIARPFLGKVSSHAVPWGPQDEPSSQGLFAAWDGRPPRTGGTREWDFSSFSLD